MHYIAIAVVIFILLVLIPMLLGVLNKLTKKQIVIVYSIIALIFGVLYLFTYTQSSSNSKNVDIMSAFQRGESIDCDGKKVSKDNYNLVSGTLAFVGKKGSAVQDIVISVEDCVVK